MFSLGIVTCYLQKSNKIGPYLMPTFILIYSHVVSSEVNEIWHNVWKISPWVEITELICLEDFRINIYMV